MLSVSLALEGLTPSRVVRPSSPAEAAALVAEARASNQAIVPWGGGTHQDRGNLPSRYDWAMEMGGLSGVIDHQPADLTVTALAGTPLAEVQAVLARHGQFLPMQAEDPDRATVGGLASARVAGPLRAGYGTPRDVTLWVEAINAEGTLVHGGARVVKNVAGYDTPKLYLGSLGSAGILTALCFKVLPIPPARPTVLAGFEEPGAATDLLMELSSARLSPSLVTLVHGPARWGEPYGVAPWVLAMGADGSAATTAWQMERFFALALAAGASLTTSVEGEDSDFIRQALMTPRAEGEVRLALSLLPGQAALLLEQLAFMAQPPLGVFHEVVNGVVRATWARGGDVEAHPWREVARMAADLGGTWTLEAAPTAWKRAGLDVWGDEKGDRPLMRRIKAAMDPTGILAPGRFAGG